MLKKIYEVDNGNNFGLWKDNVSKFLYFDSTKRILNNINIPKKVGDFGGGNGIIKKFIPTSISIDIDINKKPDIIDNILNHDKYYELVIIRYVLHYLNDYEIINLFNNINAQNILIIQFVNDDLKIKYFNSKKELKYFRTQKQLEALLPKKIKEIYSEEYYVTKQFYENRLGKGFYKKHKEILKAYYI